MRNALARDPPSHTEHSALHNFTGSAAATKDVSRMSSFASRVFGQCTLDPYSAILDAVSMQTHGHATAGPPNTPGGESVPTFLAKLSGLFAASLPRPLLH